MVSDNKKTKAQLIEELNQTRLELSSNTANKQLALLQTIEKALSKNLPMLDIYQYVGEKISNYFNATAIFIAKYDEKTNIVSFPYSDERGEPTDFGEGPLGVGYTGQVIKTKKPILVTNKKDGIKLSKKYNSPSIGSKSESMMFVPIISQKTVIGLISLQHDTEENAFSKSDFKLLQTLANSIGTSLENARLFEETNQRAAELSIINSVGEAMAENLDVASVVRIVGDKILEIFNPDQVVIGILEDANTLALPYSFYSNKYHEEDNILRKDGGMVWKTFDSRKPLRVNSVSEMEELGAITTSSEKENKSFTKSWLGVPIIVGDKLIGGVSIQNFEEHVFTEDDEKFLSILAVNMGVALENARLFDETTQRNAELAITNSVSEAISKSLEVDDVINIVGNKVKEIFNSYYTIISIINDQDMFESKYESKLQDFVALREPFPITQGLSGKIIATKKPLRLNTREEQILLGGNLPTNISAEDDRIASSWMGVPIFAGKHILGVVSVSKKKSFAFKESDEQLLSTLSTNMGVAIENARLFDETTQRNAELAVINSVQESLAAKLNITEIYEAVGEKILAIFDAQVIIITTYDIENNLSTLRFGFEKGKRFIIDKQYEISSLGQHIIANKKTINIEEKFEEAAKKYGMVLAFGEFVKSGVFVPIIIGNQVVGIVSLQNVDKENAFTKANVQLLETLVNSLSVAIDNAQLFDETNQRNSELAVINAVQEALASELDINEIYEVVGEELRKIFDAQTVVIYDVDLKKRLVLSPYAFEKGKRYYIAPQSINSLFKNVIERDENVFLINENFEEFASHFKDFKIAADEMPKSIVSVKVFKTDERILIISLQDMDKEFAFSDSDVRLLETLGGSMRVALENARLFDETTQRNSELAVINAVQEALASELDINEIYEVVGEELRKIFDAQAVVIYDADLKKRLVLSPYSFEKGQRNYTPPRPINSLFEHAIKRVENVFLINENFEEYAAQFKDYKVITGEAPKSIVSVKVFQSDERILTISLQDMDKEFAFSDSDVRLLETLGGSMRVALENARLFDETTQRNSELAVINAVQEALASELDINEIYEVVGEELRKIFKAQTVTIYDYDIVNRIVNIPYNFEKGKKYEAEPRPFNSLYESAAISEGTFLINEGFAEYMAQFKDYKVVTGEAPKSLVSCSVIKNSQRHVMLSLQDMDHEFAFSDSDVRLLETLASSMGVSLENARLFDETTRRNAELAITNSVSEAISKSLDVDEVIKIVGDKIQEIFNSDAVSIGLINKDKNIDSKYIFEFDEYVTDYPIIPKGTGLVNIVVEGKKPLLLNSLEEKIAKGAVTINEEGKIITSSKKDYSFQSWLGVPIIIGEKVIGLVYLQDLEKFAYKKNDEQLLSTLSTNMGVAIENARLFNETTRLLAETNQRAAELAITNSVSESISKSLDVDEVVKIVGDKVSEIFNSYWTIISLINDQDMFEVKYETELDNFVAIREPSPVTKGLSGIIYATKKPLLLNTLEEQVSLGAITPINLPKDDDGFAKSSLGVPIFAGNNILGVVFVSKEESYAFKESDEQLLSTLSANMGIAIENARLFNETTRLLAETDQKAAELAITNSVSESISKSLDVDEVVKIVGDKVSEIFPGNDVAIGLINHQGDLQFSYVFENGALLEFLKPLPEGKGIAHKLIKSRKSLLFNTGEEQSEAGGIGISDQEKTKTEPNRKDTESWAGVPIIVGDNVIGCVFIQSYEQNAYKESDVQLLSTLSTNMGVAIENARLFNETTRLLAETDQRAAELAITNSVSEAISKSLDVDKVVKIVGDKVSEIFNNDNVAIGLNDPLGNIHITYYLEAGEYKLFDIPMAKGQGLIGRVIETKKSIVLNTFQEQHDMGGVTMSNEGDWETNIDAKDTESWIGVPIIVSDKIIGGVFVQSYQQFLYTESDVQLLSTLSSNMGVAIENARLFNETTRLLAETDQRAAELAITNSVSESISKSLDVDEVVKIVGDKVAEIFPDNTIMIGLLNTIGELRLPYFYENGTYIAVPITIPKGVGIAQKVIETRKLILLNTNDEQLSMGGIILSEDDKWISERSKDDTESWAGVPIIVGEKIIGCVFIQSYQQYAYKESDIQLLSTLSTNMGVAIENARLFNETTRLLAETDQRAAELAITNSVSEAISKSLDVDEVVKIVGDKVSEIFPENNVAIGLTDASGNIHMPYYLELGKYLSFRQPIPKGKGLIGKLIASRKSILLGTAKEIYQLGGISVSNAGKWETNEDIKDSESWAGVPIIVGEKIIGGVFIQSYQQHAYQESDIQLLSTLSTNMGVAIENVRLFKETKRQAREMAVLEEVGREISSELDSQTLLERLGERALKLLNGKSVVLRLRNSDDTLPAVMALGENAQNHFDTILSIGEGITGSVAKSGIAEMVNSPLEDARLSFLPGTDRSDDEAIIFAPLTIREKVIGVLTIWRDKQISGEFSEEDFNFAVGLARQAAIAIENANLFDEIEQQRQYFEALFTSSPVALITLDLKGNVSGWSPAAETLFGYSTEEAINQNIDSLVANHPDIIDEAIAFTETGIDLVNKKLNIVRAGDFSITTKRARKDGTLIDVDINAMPVKVDGKPIGYVAIYNDISQIEQARLQAEEANLAKSSFLANMSHELRTPLNAIIGFTRIVKRKGENILPEKQTSNLGKVLVSAEHLLGLINTVLDISKIEAGKMEVQPTKFALPTLIEMVVSTTQPLIREETVDIECIIPDGILPITADQDKVKQILLNMLSNAAKFTLKGKIIVSVEALDNQFKIHVKDTGTGIAEDALDHIFEEFQQEDTSTTREFGGTGLGLSISRSLARLMEGDLTVVSNIGEGSTFTLSLPIIYGENVEANQKETEKEIELLDKDTKLVLVIDDNSDAVNLMKQNLEEAGYQVITATSGDEGIALAIKYQPFAITLDIMMPKKDGWQVMHDLKSDDATSSIPVIMVTIVDNKTLGFRLGAADYLVKPLKEKQVISALDKLSSSNGKISAKRVMVIDDDPNVHDLVSQLLEGKPYRIMDAKDGLEAISKISADPPDVILLDLLMPELDGFGVIEHLKSNESLNKIPVIVLTAKSLTQSEQELLLNSVSKIIQKKGLSDEYLLSEINKVITISERE